jgi:hypothetical protein
MLRCVLVLATVALATFSAFGAARAEPMDLGDRTARWVAVAFENSPRSQPGQTDTVYTPAFRAWFEPGKEPGMARVRVPGSVVERALLPGDDPLPGSFSDFVWVFDTRSGQVLSASVSGTVRKQVDWGPFHSHVATRISVQMSTASPAGFEHSRRVFGHEFFRYCEAPEAAPDCTVVEPSPYRFETGYVNAVGSVLVRAPVAAFRTFSPLGEAVFSELADGYASAPAARSSATDSIGWLEHQVSSPNR